MPLPTLSEFAAKSVGQGLLNETISLDFPLDTKCSNAIVREVLKLDGASFKDLEVHKNQLSVSKIDFSCCKVDAEGVKNLINFDLDSLDFGEMMQLRNASPDDSREDSLDIVSLLTQSLNDYSRKSMIHLGLPYHEFMEGWEEEVSKMFPSLQSMNMPSTVFDQQLHFSNFCTCFSNLLALDISCAFYLPSLQGIKHIRNLQKLSMSYVDFDDINGYKELSDLKSLKYLDVSGTDVMLHDNDTNSIRNLLAAGVRMEALEFLDCSNSSVTELELRSFVKTHPSLRTIVAMCTPCNQSTIPGIKVLNASSMSAISDSLSYLLLTDQIDMSSDFMKEVFQKLKTNQGNLEISELRHARRSLQFVLKESTDEEDKFWSAAWYLESGILEHELSNSSLSTEILHMIEPLYNAFNAVMMNEKREGYVQFVFRMFEAVVNALAPGILIPDSVLDFIFEKTLDLVDGFPEYESEEIKIVTQIGKWISGDDYQNMCTNFEFYGKIQNYLNTM
ncbi:hypothetical protein B9Z55_022641 [Caenorhabditis nigoni]|uniref:Uncharacterized protein n=1 Tax=Caenorhabditis nigoni TaxID=1611254 RepID=A0A2G5SL13_9PELO|nr:hypothetical protein B9Z55_022641 [Caenorhabditis nigoni]